MAKQRVVIGQTDISAGQMSEFWRGVETGLYTGKSFQAYLENPDGRSTPLSKPSETAATPHDKPETFVHVNSEGRTELDVVGWLKLDATQARIKEFTEAIAPTIKPKSHLTKV